MLARTLPAPNVSAPARVLLVEDDPLVMRALRREIQVLGYQVEDEHSSEHAILRAGIEPFDLILSDINLGTGSGLEILQYAASVGLDVPVILMTGAPQLESAVTALELGAKRYLSKPIKGDVLREAIVRAVEESRSERKRKSGSHVVQPDELHFARALGKLKMAYQPIVSYKHRRVFAFEALVRCTEPGLERPFELLATAETLGKVHTLGRRIRSLVASSMNRFPTHQKVFVNLHPDDLTDPDLYDGHSPLSAYAPRVVLEITERTRLDGVGGLQERLARLRELGYEIAVDDLGAGYAGLTSFVKLRPEIVKIDMSLVRGIDKDPSRQRVVRSLVELCHSAGVLTVLEGVEYGPEAETLHSMGVEFMQGYAFARPGFELVDVPEETFEQLAATA